MLEKLKGSLKSAELICSYCNKKIEACEDFSAHITMPKEKDLLVGRLDTVIARTANKIICENCM